MTSKMVAVEDSVTNPNLSIDRRDDLPIPNTKEGKVNTTGQPNVKNRANTNTEYQNPVSGGSASGSKGNGSRVEEDGDSSSSSGTAEPISSGDPSESHSPVHGLALDGPLVSGARTDTTHITAPSGAVILKRGMACAFCRRRKLRCSGGRPVCDHCARLGYICEYIDRSDKKGPEFNGTPLSTSEPLTHPPIPLPLGPSPTPSRSISSNSSRRPSVQRSGSSFNRANLPLPPPHYPPPTTNTGNEYESPLSNTPLVRHAALYPPHAQTVNPADASLYGTGSLYSSTPINHLLQTQPQPQRHIIHPPPQTLAPVPVSLPPANHPPALPPGIQYPAEDETAWYQAALKYDPPIAPQGGYIYHAPASAPPQGGVMNAYTLGPHQDSQPFHTGTNSTPTQGSYAHYETWQTTPNVPTSTPGAGSSTHRGAALTYDPFGQNPYTSNAAFSAGAGVAGTPAQNVDPLLYQDLPSHHDPSAQHQHGTELNLVYAQLYATPATDDYRPGMMHEGIYLPPDNGITQLPTPGMPGATQNHYAQYTPGGSISTSSTLYPGPYTSSSHQDIGTRPETIRTSSDQSGSDVYQNQTYLPDSSSSFPQTQAKSYYHTQPHDFTQIQAQAQAQAQGEATISTPSSTTVSVIVPEGVYYPQNMNVMYAETPEDQIESVEKLTERLGEFFLGPSTSKAEETEGAGDGTPVVPQPSTLGQGGEGEDGTRRTTKKARNGSAVTVGTVETDGLTDSARNAMLDVFFQHHKMFLDLSIPRFKYRLTFRDRRRPSLALLNAMYMWSTRMSHPPDMANMESYFYQRSVIHLDASAATGDRLMDCIRAAFLLSAFQYMNGRHHSGYLLCGHASQLAKSCGLHQIISTVFQPGQSNNPLLRSRTYLLPPPHDALELGERIHTFWAVFSLDRSSSALTGFTSSFRDSDVVTPFPRELADIASGMTTHRDDVSVRDLYRLTYQHPNERSYLRWVKAVVILERASKLVFLDPEDQSEHSRQWQSYRSDPNTIQHPGGYLEQPQYRCPEAFQETKLGLEMLVRSCGEDGVFPVDVKRNATMDGQEEVVISPAVIIFHHILAAIEMLLYDTNSLDTENTEALIGARKSVALIRELPPVPIHAVDAFAPLTWVMVAKVLIKEMHRLRQIGDLGWKDVEQEVQSLIDEIYRVGEMMPPSRMYAKGVEELMRSGQSPQTAYPRDYQPGPV